MGKVYSPRRGQLFESWAGKLSLYVYSPLRGQVSRLRCCPSPDLTRLFASWLPFLLLSSRLVRHRLYSPAPTFWAFLGQVLSFTRSCQEAVEAAMMHYHLRHSDCRPGNSSFSSGEVCISRRKLECRDCRGSPL